MRATISAVTTAALLLLTVAGSGGQDAPSPLATQGVSGLVIVDSRNLVVGTMLGFAKPSWFDGAPGFPVVILRDGVQFARLYVFPSSLQADEDAAFATVNCTGTVYLPSPPRDPSVEFMPNSALFNGGVYQARPGSTSRAVTIRAFGTLEGSCGAEPVPRVQRMYPAVRVMSAGGPWTPPFRFR
jgi:hypothetical protein